MTRPGAIKGLIVIYLTRANAPRPAGRIIAYMQTWHGVRETATRSALLRLVRDALIVRLSRGIYRAIV